MPNYSYYTWLLGLIGFVPDPTTDALFRTAFAIEFYDVVPNDENRVNDGLLLREQYQHIMGLFVDDSLTKCTVLEMLISLSRRIHDNVYYETYTPTNMDGYWFKVLLGNLDLHATKSSRQDVSVTLSNVVTRSYSPNGFGGLFPLKRPGTDQRHVEIWYQMMAWLAETT